MTAQPPVRTTAIEHTPFPWICRTCTQRAGLKAAGKARVLREKQGGRLIIVGRICLYHGVPDGFPEN